MVAVSAPRVGNFDVGLSAPGRFQDAWLLTTPFAESEAAFVSQMCRLGA